MSDMFYPDNPSRRRRAEELYSDIKGIQRTYDSLRKQFLRTADQMEPHLNEILKSLGFKSFEELTQAARQNMSPQALKEFEEIMSRMETNNRVDGIITGVAALMSLGGAAVVGVLVMIGTITAATGGAALIALGAVFAIFAVAAVIAGAIQGARVRTKLRNNIRDNFQKRRKAKLALEQMRVIVYWSALLKALLRTINVSKSHEHVIAEFQKFAKILEGPKQMFDNVTFASVDRQLRKLDSERRSWTKEDPASIQKRSFAVSFAANSDSQEETTTEGFVKVRLNSVQSEDGTEKEFTENENFFIEMETETTEKSAIVWLKKNGNYVTLYDEGDFISLKSVQKDEAEYFAEGQDDSLVDSCMKVKLVDLSPQGVGGRLFIAQAQFLIQAA
ncbi:hypothetical protein BWQ96_07298 [Gracilariopsis chorda]|uniref:Uncharacterized protein n=1 Tax=Gracilariopsis chorda TaxID=448386 RepID=A0A2V3IPA5_9FLOR|nr:hypothetical protein BWQ96_07298 [Gracilariopsis chorda]|eukprot:PXF42960.1 hypothetical protein BWQ96_07298 [Gracilariopsis chorda]